ncbi:MAG: spore cortex biosynthesis protein YabQ [Eubacteriales bacterium]
MSFEIIKEIHFLLVTVLLGVVMTFLYDGVRIIRGIVKHNQCFVSVEDLLYCSSCFVLFFMVLYKENNGMIRWFSVAGVAMGMILYKCTISSLYVYYTTKLLCCVGRLIKQGAAYINRPAKKAYGGICEKMGVILSVLKKNAKVMYICFKNRLKIMKLLAKHR